MGNRYKELLIDILTKAYQIVLAGLIITPFVNKSTDLKIIAIGVGVVSFTIFWAATIAAHMEG